MTAAAILASVAPSSGLLGTCSDQVTVRNHGSPGDPSFIALGRLPLSQFAKPTQASVNVASPPNAFGTATSPGMERWLPSAPTAAIASVSAILPSGMPASIVIEVSPTASDFDAGAAELSEFPVGDPGALPVASPASESPPITFSTICLTCHSPPVPWSDDESSQLTANESTPAANSTSALIPPDFPWHVSEVSETGKQNLPDATVPVASVEEMLSESEPGAPSPTVWPDRKSAIPLTANAATAATLPPEPTILTPIASSPRSKSPGEHGATVPQDQSAGIEPTTIGQLTKQNRTGFSGAAIADRNDPQATGTFEPDAPQSNALPTKEVSGQPDEPPTTNGLSIRDKATTTNSEQTAVTLPRQVLNQSASTDTGDAIAPTSRRPIAVANVASTPAEPGIQGPDRTARQAIHRANTSDTRTSAGTRREVPHDVTTRSTASARVSENAIPVAAFERSVLTNKAVRRTSETSSDEPEILSSKHRSQATTNDSDLTAAPATSRSQAGSPERVGTIESSARSAAVAAQNLPRHAAAALQAAASFDRPIRIRLSPPELGTLQVEISRLESGIAARFEVTTAVARTVLTDHLSAIRETLAASGLTVDRIEVRLAEPHRGGNPADSGQNGQHSGRQQSDADQQQRHYGGDNPHFDPRSDKSEERIASADRPVTRSVAGATDLIDIQV